MIAASESWVLPMPFPDRLVALRKQGNYTQQSLADEIGINVSQLKRYEAGTSQPTLAVLRKLAVALNVSADVLLFDKDERGPDDDFRLQFEAIANMSDEDKHVIRALLNSMIVKNRARHVLDGVDG